MSGASCVIRALNELRQYPATAWYMYQLRCDREVRGRGGSDEGSTVGLRSCRAVRWSSPWYASFRVSYSRAFNALVALLGLQPLRPSFVRDDGIRSDQFVVGHQDTPT